MGATNVKISLDQGLECTFALVAYRLTRIVFKRNMRKEKCESFTDRGMECLMLIYGMTKWLCWHSKLLIYFFEILRVVKYDCKTNLTINTK